MKQQKKENKSLEIEDLEKEKECLSKSVKECESFGKFALRLGCVPLIASIVTSFFNLTIGLCATALFGFIFATGWVNIARSVKLEKRIKEIEQELSKQPTQLAMDDILKQTYQPNLVKKSKVVVEDNNNELGL